MFSFFKKLPNCLPGWLYYFAFPQAVNEKFLLPQHLVLLASRILIILIGVWWYLTVVFICISWLHMCGHLSLCLSAIYCGLYVKFSSPLFNQVVFTLVSFKSSLYILKCRSLIHWLGPGIEPTSSRRLVGFVTCWAAVGNPEIFNIKSSLSIISFMGHASGVPKKSSPNPRSPRFSPTLSSRSFTVLLYDLFQVCDPF